MTAATGWYGQAWRGGLWGGVPQGQRRFRDSSAVALFARMTGLLPSRKELMNTYIAALKAGNVWDKRDVLQVYAANASGNALLNWKGTSFTAVNNGATFTADRGFAGDAVSTWTSTGYDASTAAGQYSLNNASVSMWVETDGAATTGHGASSTIYLRQIGATYNGRINDPTTEGYSASAATGLFSMVRRGASDKRGFFNGVQIGATTTTASTSIASGVIGLNKYGASYTNDRIALFSAGSALSDAEELAFYNAARTYMTGVGVA